MEDACFAAVAAVLAGGRFVTLLLLLLAVWLTSSAIDAGVQQMQAHTLHADGSLDSLFWAAPLLMVE